MRSWYWDTNTKCPPHISPPEYMPLPQYKPPKKCLQTSIGKGLIFGIFGYIIALYTLIIEICLVQRLTKIRYINFFRLWLYFLEILRKYESIKGYPSIRESMDDVQKKSVDMMKFQKNLTVILRDLQHSLNEVRSFVRPTCIKLSLSY